VAIGAAATAQTLAVAPPAIRAEGGRFLDDRGRVVLLRGINVAGDAKTPPFAAPDPAVLESLARLGFNVIRLVVIWEAGEPEPGQYDDTYLAGLTQVAYEAGQRGMATIVDFHQDGFSRNASQGCGDGFPLWALSPRARASSPDNGTFCRPWPFRMATDPATYASFADFYADRHGVRSRYLLWLDRVATAMSSVPGVIGYDPINEPWGSESRDLAPFYADAARVLRARHPDAILFLEGHITTNSGRPTFLPRPRMSNVAYAPHYYHPATLVTGWWHGLRLPVSLAFGTMSRTADRWDAPLFLGEFGIAAGTRNGASYIDALYDQLDARLASGAQWNVSPRWNAVTRDGWNTEDFSIVLPDGRLRDNFEPRPYPRATAGEPVRFDYTPPDPSSDTGARISFGFVADPSRGDTEVLLPTVLFAPGTAVRSEPADVPMCLDSARQLLLVRPTTPGPVIVEVLGPPPSPSK
jgi:endoglycosylceramidase